MGIPYIFSLIFEVRRRSRYDSSRQEWLNNTSDFAEEYSQIVLEDAGYNLGTAALKLY